VSPTQIFKAHSFALVCFISFTSDISHLIISIYFFWFVTRSGWIGKLTTKTMTSRIVSVLTEKWLHVAS
jgi:hypothetical protein